MKGHADKPPQVAADAISGVMRGNAAFRTKVMITLVAIGLLLISVIAGILPLLRPLFTAVGP